MKNAKFISISTQKKNQKYISGGLDCPEKKRLFETIDIPKLFPSLNKNKEIQKLWKDFYCFDRPLVIF